MTNAPSPVCRNLSQNDAFVKEVAPKKTKTLPAGCVSRPRGLLFSRFKKGVALHGVAFSGHLGVGVLQRLPRPPRPHFGRAQANA